MSQTEKQLKIGILTIIILVFGLTVTTFALVMVSVNIENNIFSTASVSININDNKPIINDDETYFEPGVAVQKEFYVANTGNVDIWYRLYFTNIYGSLKDKIYIRIANGTNIIYEGIITEIDQENSKSTDTALCVGEKRILTITFYIQESADSDYENESLTFDLKAEATQVKNNPDREF